MLRPAARLRRALFLTVALTLLALVQVERSLPEMRGQPPEPTRILRLTPRAGGVWAYAVLGREGSFRSDVVRFDHGELVVHLGARTAALPLGAPFADAKRALPIWVGSLLDWLKTWWDPSHADPGDGGGVLVLHDQEVDRHV